MARFLHHGPCPSCGSRDNLAHYDDGSAHCFGGCGYYQRPTHAPRREYSSSKIPEDNSSTPKIPEDAGHDFPQEAVEWLSKYQLGIPEAIQRGLLWSNSRRQLIFNMDQVWQARNFNPEAAAKRKYFTAGDVNENLPIYACSLERNDGAPRGSLALVEDCVSAIKIARQNDSMPLLGSHLSVTRLNRLARLYSGLVVWLDSDKLKEARGIAEKAKWLGLSARTIFTDEDPKCYSDEQIKGFLYENS